MRIGFLGFGEAARAFCDSLARESGPRVVVAYDILLRDPARSDAMRSAMRERGVAVAEGPGGLVEADWVISAVTADQSLEAVRALTPHLLQGQVVIDLNSVSPARKQETAALVVEAGAGYLDMAVMAPVHPRGHRTPVLLAGAGAETAWKQMAEMGFEGRVVASVPGAATAIKMVRSLFVKGLEAITVETLLAARASGCLDEILMSLSGSYPGLDLPAMAPYHFERTLRHGVRRAAEMREGAATLRSLGLCGGLADGIAEVQQRMGDCGRRAATEAGTLQDLADSVLAARRDGGD